MGERSIKMLKKLNKGRLDFVRFWARYVKGTSTLEWSKQQKLIIDSVLENANQDRELYMKVKEIAEKIRKGKQRRKIKK